MKTQIIQIGNSAGLILPKTLLQACRLRPKTAVSVVELDGSIIIKPVPRTEWLELFQAYAKEDEEKAMPDFFVDENTDWVW